jgi:hypothetical protein
MGKHVEINIIYDYADDDDNDDYNCIAMFSSLPPLIIYSIFFLI